MTFSLRRLLIGDPLATSQMGHQKLSKIIALPVFASDALSSVAFATEEIMAALLVAGAAPYFGLTPWISLGIVLLLAIVTVSYQQTISAYPGGGGAYTVATDNLGALAGKTAGAALLLDYILNAAVCASAGAAAMVSLALNYGHHIEQYTAPLAVAFLAFVALVNLRGVKESGVFFAVPVYGFVVMMGAVIIGGLWLMTQGHLVPVHTPTQLAEARIASESGALTALEPFGIFLLLHAFASGCTALTGVEAISNGVGAFHDPAPRNARITMVWMALLLGGLFMGASFLAPKVGAIPPNAAGYGETVLSQVGRAVFGTGFFYLVLQFATCGILILSTNTSFADFPRLSALMARDGLLPRPLGNVGDKLVFDRGISALAFCAALLVIGFKGSVHALIPLFAIGVFLSFTLSQGGMFLRWLRTKGKGWLPRAFVNGLGAITTLVVTVVFALVKFAEGAWVIVLLIPALIALFSRIQRHYQNTARQLSLEGYRPTQARQHYVFVLVPDIHRGVIPALQYARTIAPDAHALHVAIDPSREARLRERWALYGRGVPLTILNSPYRELARPVLEHLAALRQRDPGCLITMVVPEAIATSWWGRLLHGQAALLLLWRLRFQPGVVAVNVPYFINENTAPATLSPNPLP